MSSTRSQGVPLIGPRRAVSAAVVRIASRISVLVVRRLLSTSSAKASAGYDNAGGKYWGGNHAVALAWVASGQASCASCEKGGRVFGHATWMHRLVHQALSALGKAADTLHRAYKQTQGMCTDINYAEV